MDSHDIRIDKGSNEPIYQQIYEQVREGILVELWQPGDKLPSIRCLAKDLGVARNTVDTAYNQLSVEGYVSSRQGSGFTVQAIDRDALLSTLRGIQYQPAAEPEKAEFAYDFRYGNLLSGSFPAEDWRRLMSEILSGEAASQLTSYNNPRGEFGLRAEIARHLQEDRGVICKPEQVIMTSGTQQSLELLLSLFDSHRDGVAMENPGFPPARAVFRSRGFSICPIRSDSGPELYLDDLNRSEARIVYATPSHQFPVGKCMSLDTRLKLIKYAQDNDAYIVEDNYDSEFRYNSQPVPSLQSIDQLGRVIYMGSFSKALSPALRMGYMVLPPLLLEDFTNRLGTHRCTVPWLEQETLRLFMERGLWKRHLRRSVIANRKRRTRMLEAVNECFGPARVKVHTGNAGLFLLLEVANNMTQDELVATAAQKGVGLTNASHYWIDPGTAPERLVLLGFSATSEDVIEKGVKALEEAWF